MTENHLGLTENNEGRRLFMRISKVFHPDKVNKEHSQLASEIFNDLIYQNSIKQDRLASAVNEISGHDGILIYEKYPEQFTSLHHSPYLDTIKTRKKIKKIVENNLFADQEEQSRVLNMDFYQKISLRKNHFRRGGSLSLSTNHTFGKVFLIPGLRASWDKKGNTNIEQELKIGFLSKIYSKSLRVGFSLNSINPNSPNLFCVISGELLELNVELSPISDQPLSIKVRKIINDISSVVLMIGFPNGSPTGYLIQSNRFNLSDTSLLKVNFQLYVNALKTEVNYSYKCSKSVRFFIRSVGVWSFKHRWSQYYKFEEISFGVRKAFSRFKVSLSVAFKHYGFKNLNFGLSTHRINISIPLSLDINETLTNIGLSLAWSLVGYCITLIGSEKESKEA